MKIADFEKRMENAVLVADGAMGSVLFDSTGVQRCFEELNILQPEAVFRVHQAYIQAGAQIIETNTFGANRSKLAALGLADKVAAFNHRGVKLAREAREAAPHEVLIAGSIGPLGMGPGDRPAFPRRNSGDLSRTGARSRGTRRRSFYSGDVLEHRSFAGGDRRHPLSFLAARRRPAYFFRGRRPRLTARGLPTPPRAWRARNIQAHRSGTADTGPAIATAGARRIGCGWTADFRRCPMPAFRSAWETAPSTPALSPDTFALFAREAAALGARIVGGCCGTSPEHIRALAEAVRGLPPAAQSQSVKVVSSGSGVAPAKRAVAKREPESGIWRKLQAGELHAFGRDRSPKRHFARSRL